jgi:hypothetical protein
VLLMVNEPEPGIAVYPEGELTVKEYVPLGT